MRDRFEPTTYSRVCSLHFDQTDFETASTDTVKSRRLKRPNLKLRKLKPNAVPSLHPNVPLHLQPMKHAPRVSSATTSARLQHANERIEAINFENLTRDDCNSFSDLLEKVRSNSFPTGYVIVYKEDSVIFLLVSNLESNDSQPRVEASVSISNDLEFLIFVNGDKLNNSKVNHLLKTRTISSVIELSNVLAFVKSRAERVRQPNNDTLIEFLKNDDRIDTDNLVRFVTEQLILSKVQKWAVVFPGP